MNKIPSTVARCALATSICLTAFVSSSLAATYTQDFEFDDGTTDLGDGTTIGSTTGVAQVLGGALRLSSTATGSERSSFRIPALADSSSGWTATFSVTMTDAIGGNPPADGFSFSYGAIPALTANDATAMGHGAAEAGMTTGNEISFQVDTWRNGDANSPGVGVLENGVALAGGRLDGTIVPTDGGVSGIVNITWTPVTVDFTTAGLTTDAEFENLTHTFAGDDSHSWVFSARTGGATQDLFIDDLVITTGLSDTDGDGLPDSWEIFHELDEDDNGENPNNNGVKGDPDQGADGDPDMDNLTNMEEFELGTSPQLADTDMDGLNDDVESDTGIWAGVSNTGTSPLNPDSDNDGLADGVENPDLPWDPDNADMQPGSDPNLVDTDGDELSDGNEVLRGLDPTTVNGLQTRYEQNFDGFADGETELLDGSVMNGTANIQGEQLEMTRDGVAGGFSSFNIPPIANSQNGWTATFDLTISDSAAANEPADGMSFNYGNFTLTETGSAEEGMENVASVTDNISFEIDTWMNTDLEQGVNISEKVDSINTNLSFTNGPILLDGTMVSGPVEIVYDPANDLSFTTDGLLTNADFKNVVTSFVGDEEFLFGISARVGGANQTLLIDNLVIETGIAGDDFRILAIDRVVVPGMKGGPDTVSVTITWRSREGRNYGVYASPDMKGKEAWEELDDGVEGEIGETETSYTEIGLPLDTVRRFYQIRELP